LWNLRDGVLAWLYELRVEQVTISEAEPTAFMAATSWSDTVVTAAELNSAIDWLKDEGYVDGVGTMQGIVLRPCLSAYGERYAASGKSVRDLPGVVEVQSPYLHIEGSKGVAVAFGSHHVTQTVSVYQKLEQAQVLAEAIEQALPAVSDEKIRADAEKVAAEIRAESSSETPKPGRLKALAATAMTSIATAAGTDLGKAIAQAAIPLLS
jgi:SOS response regulatory protein OraA/RecX